MAAFYEQQQHIPESSSPRKGIIRLVQHDKSPIMSNDHTSLPPKPEARNDAGKPSIHGANLASDPPIRQQSFDERKAFNRQRRKENDHNRSRNMDRTNVMRREHSAASHNVREGMESVSLLTRSSPLEDGSKPPGRYARVNTNDGEASEASDVRSVGRRNATDHNTHKSGEDYSKRYHHNNSNRGGGHHGSARELHSRHGGRLNDSDIASISHGGGGGGGGGGGRSTGGSASGAKLFDPRKDDPVRFAANRKGLGITSTDGTGPISVTGMSDSRSFASSATPSVMTMSTASSEGKERRRRRGPASRATTDSGEGSSGKRKGQSAAEGAISDNNSYVIELKRRYRDVVVLERKLQDEHKVASEQERKYQAEQSSTAQITNSNSSMSRSISSNRTNIDRHGFNPDGSLHHSYWLDLIAKHRTLAELHVAFMEAALRPGLPASLHSLPQSYKIPTRLWHTAFHSLLERFRQSLPDWQTCIAMRDSGVPPADREKINEMLDLFTEYIYYAYSYYTNILESELFKVFRSSWIENLGDLARYRMAVAKIMSFLGVRDGVKHGAERRDSGSQSRDKKSRSIQNQSPISDQGKMGEADEEALEVASAEMGKDQASIGAAAAQDWDLEEKEIWRSTARGWYAKGLADVPGTGRLHHHLGILSRDDDLRSLYHFCKSLTTSHPYLSARESILPLFERSTQARRLSEEASIVDLFVHMHGILFTRIQVDDFDGVYVRFKKLLTLRLRENDFRNGSDNVLLSSSSWMMMATISIAAMLQYGAGQESSDDTKIQQNKADTKVEKSAEGNEAEEGEGEEEDEDDEQVEGDEIVGEEEESTQSGLAEGSNELPCATQKACRLAFDILEMVIDIFAEDNKAAAANPYITLMLTFLSQECKTEGYLRKLEKFVPWESLVTLGNSIPSSVESIDPRNDATLKIRGDAIPLPEDWCLRGMAWVGRRVYERGFWKPHKIERLGLRNSLALFENELEMIDRCTRCTNGGEKDSDRKSQSESPHHNDEEDDDNDDDDDDDDEDSENHGIHGGDQSSRPRLTLTVLRWKRITHALTILIKTVPGMDFDIETGYVHARHGRMILAPPLSKKVIQWRADEARAEVEGAIGHLKLAALEGRTASPDQNEDAPRSAQISLKVEEDDDLDEDEVEVPSTAETGDISEEIKELTKRRNELRKQLQIGKSANHYRSKHTNSHDTTASRQQSSTKSKTSTQTSIRIVPGYTTLLLDTNVMLTPTDILSQLIKSKRWMVIIPLSVVTELDGLKRREGDVGKRAQDAIKFLETKVKTHSTNFKVQTSRGNYLTDLRFRTEDIDFTANKQFEGENEDSLPEAQTQNDSSEGNEDGKFAMARSVDDVILRCLSWQSGAHFRNRLLLLCSNDEERAKREAEIAKKIVPSVARAVLVTLDRNLRIKARFRSLSAIGPSELIDLLLEESSA